MQILYRICETSIQNKKALPIFIYLCDMFELLFTGFYLGGIHILSAPDHLAAIVPLSLMDKKRSWQIGLLWGIGHLIGLLGLGILLYYFKSLINLEALTHYGILYIAILLLLVGIWIIYKSKNSNLLQTKKTHGHLSKITVGTGIVHGFFGFSHIYTLAPTLSMNDISFFSYFGGFAFGSIVSVVSFTYLLCFLPERLLNKQSLYQKIMLGSGILTTLLGVIMVILFFKGQSIHIH